MTDTESSIAQGQSAFARAGITRPAFLGRNQIVGLALFAVGFLILPRFSDYSSVVGLTIVYAIVGSSLVIAFGAAGQFTLGHSIFLGVGAFLSANITASWGRGLETELPIALGVTFLLGLAVGLPSLRVSELYLALATFAIAFVGVQVLFEWKQFTAGGSGKPAGPLELFGREIDRGVPFMRVSLMVLVVVFWIVSNLLDGKTGRAMNALRTSETAAKAVGLNVAWLKILAFGISGAITGMAGVLYIHTLRFAGPENFGVNLSILLILTLVIGGRRRLAGAVLGAMFVRWLPEFVRSAQEYEGIIYGGTLVVLTLFSPGGLFGLAQMVWAPIRRLIPLNRDSRGSGGPEDSSNPLASPSLAALKSDVRRGHLVVENAEVVFGGVRAVDGVSFEIEAGAVTGLIGSNGAGKTTCFNAMTGHVSHASGLYVLDGADLSQRPIHQRALAGMGRTFQNLNLHGDLRVLDHALLGLNRELGYSRLAESIRLPPVLRAERAAHEKAAELLEHMQLLDYWDNTVEDLPYGLQKRVDVVRALATNPSILLLDEPAAGLPTAEATEMMGYVIEYAAHIGAGVLVIEHNVELVADVCERVIVMDAGKILADGSAESVMRDERVIAAYLGT
jgi:ABC-type branched-subunit amino acid transport system ATPase component/ABC-type branched-subunit amino acid transport system permease subunit